MNLKNLVEDFSKNPGDEVCMLSTIDHSLTHKNSNQRLEYVLDINEQDISKLSKLTKVYIAGMIEYIYNSINKKAPDWIMQKEYTLDSIESNRVYNELRSAFSNTDDESFNCMMMKELENSLPEFRWRNMICDGIFDSF